MGKIGHTLTHFQESRFGSFSLASQLPSFKRTSSPPFRSKSIAIILEEWKVEQDSLETWCFGWFEADLTNPKVPFFKEMDVPLYRV